MEEHETVFISSGLSRDHTKSRVDRMRKDALKGEEGEVKRKMEAVTSGGEAREEYTAEIILAVRA